MSPNIFVILVLTPGVAWQTEQNSGLKVMLTIEDCHWDFIFMLFMLQWEIHYQWKDLSERKSTNENPYTAWRIVSYAAVCRLSHSSENPFWIKSTGWDFREQASVPLWDSWVFDQN